jgi:hypothetical protein
MDDHVEFPLPAIERANVPAKPTEAEQLALAAKEPLSTLNTALLRVIDEHTERLKNLRKMVEDFHTRSLDQVDSHAAIVPLVGEVVAHTDHAIEIIRSKLGRS